MVNSLIVGITGASGAVYGVRLLEVLRETPVKTHLVVSKWGQRTLEHETGRRLDDLRALADHHYGAGDMAALMSSGSGCHRRHGDRALFGAKPCGDRLRAQREPDPPGGPTS